MVSNKPTEERRRFSREGYRFTCELTLHGKNYTGIGTNLSPMGLFIQTSAPFAAGDTIHVRIHDSDGTPIDIDANVVRKMKTIRSVSPITGGSGIGLEVTFASEAYYQLLAALTINHA